MGFTFIFDAEDGALENYKYPNTKRRKETE